LAGKVPLALLHRKNPEKMNKKGRARCLKLARPNARTPGFPLPVAAREKEMEKDMKSKYIILEN